MKKKELLAMPQITVSPEMAKVAAENPPYQRENPCWPGKKEVREPYMAYMKCIEENGVLKACFFLRDSILTGGHLPAYEVYISKKARDFITFDRLKNKWREAMLDRLSFSGGYYYDKKAWADPESEAAIKSYFSAGEDGNQKILLFQGAGDGGYWEIQQFQMDVREEQLKARHKKETDPWDADLEQVPALPRDWERWVRRVGITDHFIFYRYKKGGAKTGYCTHCEKEVPIKNPRHNKTGRCPRCRGRITYKAEGKAGWLQSKLCYIHLFQLCRDGFVLREFEASCRYDRGTYRIPKVACFESRRVIYPNGGHPRAYYMGWYKHREKRWIASGLREKNYWGSSFAGRVYGKTLPSVKNRLLRTGLPELIYHNGMIADPEAYLSELKRAPGLEQLVKAGFSRLVHEYFNTPSCNMSICRSRLCTTPAAILGLSRHKIKRLRGMKGGALFLFWLKYEDKVGKTIADDVIQWFCKENISPDDLGFILGLMSPLQIKNYITKQLRRREYGSAKDILSAWADYLSMAKRLKLDINDAIIYRARKLRQRHDELVKECNRRDIGPQVKEILKKHPHINEICRSLGPKYNYVGDSMQIKAPESIADIIIEGRQLRHCLSGSDRYWDRIEQRESYILFLRKNTDPDKPYYTLEVEPGGTIRQKRSKFDRQGSDIEKVQKFLTKWQSVISKRITDEDRALAVASRTLRMEEFTELREKNAIIYTGAFAGQKLVDVLTADLMVNQAA